jgi:hypothetical protein
MPDVNLLAVLVAGVASFFFGGLWYSKALFCDAWGREAGIPPRTKETTGRHPATVFGTGIALGIVTALVMAWLLGPAPEVGHAVKWGALTGAGFVAASFGINYAFAGRSLTLWAIDAGYHVIQFTICALILGLWH